MTGIWKDGTGRRWTACGIAALVLVAAVLSWLQPPVRATPAGPAKDILVVGGDAHYPPFQFTDGRGRPQGFDVELLRLVAHDLGVEAQFELGDWGRSLQRLQQGEVDVVPMFATAARGKRFLFTRPYLMRYHAVFGRPGQPRITGLAELKGQTVGVQRASLAWEALQALGDAGPRMRLFDNETSVLPAVAHGEVDYALVPSSIGYQTINDQGLTDVVALSPPLLEHSYVLAVRDDRPELVAALDGALEQVRQSGAQDRLYVEWIGNLGAPRNGPGPRLLWLLLPLAVIGGLGAWRLHSGRRQAAGTAPWPPEPARGSGPRGDAQGLELLAELREAVVSGTLGFALQPKLDLRTGRWRGAELLARWDHPRHGLLLPDAFVPLAEQAGATGPMTLYLIRRGLAEFARWPGGADQPTLSVNVAANDLADPVLVEAIITAAGQYGPALILEVTETDVMHDPERVAKALGGLRERGIRISLDDFGTGHSSLTNLRQLAPDELKIDRSFVMSVLDSGSDRAIVRATIQLAHELGAQVTAEGIEDEATLRWLAEAGCDCAPGYVIAQPLPPGEFAARLARPGRR